MRKIRLFWYGIFIGTYSLQAKGNQENVEKIGNVYDDVFIHGKFLSIIKDERKSDGKTDEDLCDTNELILPENAISWECTDSKTIKNKVYRGGKCELQCKEFYKRVVGKSFNF